MNEACIEIKENALLCFNELNTRKDPNICKGTSSLQIQVYHQILTLPLIVDSSFTFRIKIMEPSYVLRVVFAKLRRIEYRYKRINSINSGVGRSLKVCVGGEGKLCPGWEGEKNQGQSPRTQYCKD